MYKIFSQLNHIKTYDITNKEVKTFDKKLINTIILCNAYNKSLQS